MWEQKIVPMEPRSSPILKEGPEYCYQVKWDGFRLLAFGKGKDLYLQGRGRQEKTGLYPELAVLPELVNGKSFVLDGELVAFKEGLPDFYTLMQRKRLHFQNYYVARVPVSYMVFDLLQLDGTWLLQKPWELRQELLRETVEAGGPLYLTPNFEEGPGLLQAVKEKGMEGVVAKKKESPYIPGPRKSSYWFKTKVERYLQAYVGGVILQNGQPVSLLLGLEQEKKSGIADGMNRKLQYIGSVSSGLTREGLAAWQRWVFQNRSPHPPFHNPPRFSGRKIAWSEPLRQVQVIFNEWTPGLKLRAPRIAGSSFSG